MTKLTKRSALIAAAVLAAGVFGASTLFGGTAAAVETGQRAPAFSVRDASGATRTLSEFAGRTVVLEWTNHGCPYVRKHYDAGNMQALQRQAAQDGVVWLQIISSRPGAQGHLDAAGARARVAT
ncbi:MAG TPA: redoxin domain-containing protein, partial [Terricaulis sp.]|nr:redoxin domain-containing protein [Terricaulis sp.]